MAKKKENTSVDDAINVSLEKINKARDAYDRLWSAQKDLKELGIDLVITKN